MVKELKWTHDIEKDINNYVIVSDRAKLCGNFRESLNIIKNAVFEATGIMMTDDETIRLNNMGLHQTVLCMRRDND